MSSAFTVSPERLRRAWLIATIALVSLAAAPRASARGCSEVSDIVGERRCSRYGDYWATERLVPLVFELGVLQRTIAPGGHDFRAKYSSRGPTLYTFDGNALGASTVDVGGALLRVHGLVWRGLYFGLEVDIGLGAIDAKPFTVGSYVVRDTKGIDLFSVQMGLPIGYRIPAGPIGLRAETLVGITTLSVDQLATSPENSRGASAAMVHALIEPRLGVEVWLTSILTLTAQVGVNAFDTRERFAGLAFGWHLRAHDGTFGE